MALLKRSWAAKIGMRMKGHRGDAGREPLAANHQSDWAARRGAGALDIAHRNRRADARAEAAGGDAADRPAFFADNVGAFARRSLAVRPQANAASRRTIGHLAKNAFSARKAAFFAPSLRDRPREACLDGARRLVDVVAIEAEAGLQPKGIAGAKADRPNLRVFEKAADEGRRLTGGKRNLKAILAGVARAGQKIAFNPVAFIAGRRHRHEWHGGDARPCPGKNLSRLRPLQRDQRATGERLEP